MKFASFIANGGPSYGVVRGATLVEPSGAFRAQFADLRAVLAADALTDLANDAGGPAHDSSEVEFLPTIPNADKVIGIGVNYRPHVEEMGRKLPEKPVIFVRFRDSQVGHRQSIMKASAAKNYDYEGELAVVVGRAARHVSRNEAFNYVAGYTCFMDGTARDWQKHSTQFTQGKNFHHSGAMGPYLVSRDEVPEVKNLKLQTRVNGELMQDDRLSELIFDIPYLIEYLSTFTELLPGDVIATGTPDGVGAARTPPVWLRDGDDVAVDIDGVGCLTNTVREE